MPSPLSYRTYRPQRVAGAFSIDWAVVSLVFLAIVLIGTVPSTLLTHLKIHYVTTGGSFLEKFHPATYVIILAFCLTLLRDPIGEIDRMASGAKLVLPYLFSLSLLLAHAVFLGRPFTSTIDTFLLPLLFCLTMWSLSPADKAPLPWAIHLVMFVNIVIGYYEYVSGHRVVPLTVGDMEITSEWRSTGLFGHPLIASGLVGAYTIALMLRPALCPSIPLRAAVILACLGSLFAFGGRTALVMVLFVLGYLAAATAFRLFRGARVPLTFIIIAICGVFLVIAGVLALLDVGFLDKMLLRFSSDKGSAWARVASLQLLASFDWRELLLGPDPTRADFLQTLMGIQAGIENFWIACIVQYGIVHTVLLTIGLACFLAEVLHRSQPAARAIVLFIVVVAASSVSFSSKGVLLTQYLALILVLLSRERLTGTLPVRQVRLRGTSNAPAR
jgi:hypothetical protein